MKTLLVTGASRGVGFEICKQASTARHKVIALSRNISPLEGISNVYPFSVDLSGESAVVDFVKEITSSFQSIDVLINNAGIKVPNHPVTDLPLEELHKIFSVNFFGQWHAASIFGKRMIEQGTPASIYNVGSELSFFSSVPNATAYMATKHAILGLTEGLREEMPEFIDVGLIVPGFVGTEMHTAEAAAMGMNADQFAALVMPQISAGERFVVSHAFNIEHINARFDAISNAYSSYAPRYEGDDAYDVKTLISRQRS